MFHSVGKHHARTVGALAALLILAAATPVQAAAVIDDFTGANDPGWPVFMLGVGSTSLTDTGLADTIGGQRDTTITATALDVPGLDSVVSNVFSGSGGLLDLSTSAGATAKLNLTYGAGGLLNADFSADAGIVINLAAYDAPGGQPMSLSVELFSDYGGANQESVVLPANVTAPGAQVIQLAFNSVPSSVDFSDIDYITAEFVLPKAGDLRLDTIETFVPEPATMALLAAGLAGLVVRRRRKA